MTKRFVWGEGIDECVRATLPDAADIDGDMDTDELVDLYYHQNSLGSVAAVTDLNGVVKESYRYTAFGAPTIFDKNGAQVASTQVKQPFMFTGARFDFEEGSNLYQMRLRYYDPAAGRFISRDPLGLWGDSGQRGNGQSYCAHDPINRFDPLGLGGVGGLMGWSPFPGPAPAPMPGGGGFTPRGPAVTGPAWVYLGVAMLTEGWFELYGAHQTETILLEQGANLAKQAQLLQRLRLLKRMKQLADGVEEAIDYGLTPDPAPAPAPTPTPTPAPAPAPEPEDAEFGKALEILTEPEEDEEVVYLYHGTMFDFGRISQNGLSTADLPTYASRNFFAAANAIGPGRRAELRNAGDQRDWDSGIVVSIIPRRLYDEYFTEMPYPHGFGFVNFIPLIGYDPGQVLISTECQVEIFNRYMVKWPPW